MKQRLNTTKSQLNSMPLQRWHKHTRKLNPAATVTGLLRKQVQLSTRTLKSTLCLLQVQPELLTQAWEKFYECFSVYNLGPKARPPGEGEEGPQPYNSVHLCEAPGAFVTSLNHALSVQHPQAAWTWLASTLNPHYEGNDLGYMINDDR